MHPLFRPARLLIAFVLFVSTALQAAKLPEWAQPYITPEALAWKTKSPIVVLSDESQLTYQTPTLVRRTDRTVLKINEPDPSKSSQPICYSNTNSDKILSFTAWSQSPSGKVTALPKSAFNVTPYYPSSHFWNHLCVLTLSYPPGFEPGSLLLWEITYETKSHPIRPESWSAPSPQPLYHGRFSATPPPGTRFISHHLNPQTPPPQVDPATGQVTWEISKLAPTKASQPDGFFPTPTRISVTCPTPEIPFTTWTDYARAITPNYAQTSAVTPELTAQATALTAGKTTRWEKIRALTDFIQTDVSYLNMDDDAHLLTGNIPQPAATCLNNRYGDCKDKANLLVTLLRSIGDNGHVLLVYSGNPTRVPADIPISSFNHAITAIPADADTPAHWPIATHPTLGRFVIVDTTSGINPLGTLPIRDQGGLGLLVHPDGDLLRLPTDTPGLHGTTVTATLKLDGNTNAQLQLSEITDGQTFAKLINFREKLRGKNFQSALEKRLTKLAPRIENLTWSETPDPAHNRHTLTFSCELLGFTRRPGPDLLIFNPPALTKPTALSPWQTPQPGQCWLPLAEHTATYTLALPPGTTLAEPIAPLDLHAGETNASFSAELKDNTLTLRTHYLQPAGFLEKPAYESLRALTQKFLQTLQRPILLKLPAAL